jgi:hypothetical protein
LEQIGSLLIPLIKKIKHTHFAHDERAMQTNLCNLLNLCINKHHLQLKEIVFELHLFATKGLSIHTYYLLEDIESYEHKGAVSLQWETHSNPRRLFLFIWGSDTKEINFVTRLKT